MSKATPLEANNGKLDTIVELIASLTLLETSELVALLKTRLNISEIAMPAASSAAPVGGAATEAVTEEEKPVEKTEFTVKLEKFDAAAKAKIIREIKGLIPGANLVEVRLSIPFFLLSPVSLSFIFLPPLRTLILPVCAPETNNFPLCAGQEVCRVGAGSHS